MGVWQEGKHHIDTFCFLKCCNVFPNLEVGIALFTYKHEDIMFTYHNHTEAVFIYVCLFVCLCQYLCEFIVC